jgi:hypothetical protein
MSSFGNTTGRVHSRRRASKSAHARKRWERNSRKLLVERFEDRVLLAGDTLHGIAAGNIDVEQFAPDNGVDDISVTLPYAFNGFQVPAGSNRGDYRVQLGDDASNDREEAILITSVRENGRDNGDGTTFSTSSIDWGFSDPVNYFIPIHASPAGSEFNVNVAAAFFPYADGWLGGWAANDSNGGPMVDFDASDDEGSSHPDLELGTHLIDEGGGRYTVDLTSFGINSQTDGVLIVNGGKNEDNYALSQDNADGTWTIYNHDNGANGGSYEADGVAFVFIPVSNTDVISGRIMEDATTELASGPVTVTDTGTGTFHMTIDGYTPLDGVLLISPEGGDNYNVDNVVNYEANGDGWDIETRDITGMGLQDLTAGEAVASFVFIPGPDRIRAVEQGELVTTESGATTTLSLVLDRAPTENVTVPVTSSNTAEGTVDVTEIVFTPEDWSDPHLITVTGVDDTDVDGDVTYTVEFGAATSADPNFDGYDADDIDIVNLDDETTRVEVYAESGLETTEAGGTVSFTVFLASATAPTDTVTIAMDSSDPSEGTAAAIEFTTENWNQPQVVTVTGVNDDVMDGDIAYTIVTTAGSADAAFDGLAVDDVSITNLDDDVAGIVVDPTAGLVVNETGSTAEFSVVLTSEPTADVVISLVSSDTTEGIVTTSELIFTPANWNETQYVTVVGVDDTEIDGNVSFSIVTTVEAGDADYLAIDPSDVSVVNDDDEPRLILNTPVSQYGVGDPAFRLDTQAEIFQPGQNNFDTGSLTVTITNPDPSDVLGVAEGTGSRSPARTSCTKEP